MKALVRVLGLTAVSVIAVFSLIQLMYPGNTVLLLDIPYLESIISLIGSSLVVVAVYYCSVASDKMQRMQNINETLSSDSNDNASLYLTLFNHNATGLLAVSLDGKIIKTNQKALDLLGFSEDLILDTDLQQLLFVDSAEQFKQHIQEVKTGLSSQYQTLIHFQKREGQSLYLDLNLFLVRSTHDRPHLFLLQLVDVTQQKKAEMQLRDLANQDPITGLPNRSKLEEHVDYVISQMRRNNQSFAMLMINLDRFKTVNQTLGIEGGDLLLQITANRVRRVLRKSDFVARIGGDEFVVVLSDFDSEQATAAVAQKILDSMNEVATIKSKEVYLTASIGISVYPNDGESFSTLINNADMALFRAKENGRNDYHYFTSAMTSKARDKMLMQNLLGDSLIREDLRLNYQPIVDIYSGKITGVEALLRWKNAKETDITPDEIVRIAEESGMIHPISNWILETACKQVKAWRDMGLKNLTVSVNLSGRQFKKVNLAQDIKAIADKVGLPLSALIIEVTEQTVMEDVDTVLDALYELKEIGVKIAIDNFGTGYWSLGNLKKLSIDQIKIDKDFIHDFGVDETTTTIVQAIISMVDRLNIQVVAEGVETREQLLLLKNEGCASAQGYYFSRPRSSKGMTQYFCELAEKSGKVTS